ncbi:MAG TPA: hypothetical protein VHP83_27645 [Aggregatilineaceae bacterium]|nr:hypothetical protein [Aggregatilineaceae bacterium]
MFPRTRILLFFCLLLLIPLPPATGQAQDSNDWQIPHIECGEECNTKSRLDEQGNLFIYVEQSLPAYHETLYFIQRGTNQLVEYDIQQLYPGLNLRRDFIPYASQKLLIFDSESENPFVWLDLQTGQAILFDLDITGYVEECNISSFVTLAPSFYRIGDSGILFCSRTDDATSYIHLAHIQDGTLVIENTFDMGIAAHPEALYLPPWRSIATSLDGKIYVVAYPRNQILDQIAPQYGHAYDAGTYYVILRYSQTTQAWDAIVIDASAERWNLEGTDTFSPFVGADESGNLYFFNRLITPDDRHADFVKYNPQGEVVWHLTEADFGNQVFHDVLLLGENQFILDFGADDLEYVVQEESTATDGSQ